MIEARNLTKHYGTTLAVDDLSFDVKPGIVTGFLGPNGAGKTTTMRIMLGLDHPNNGSVKIDGKEYRDLPCPLREVGALLDAKAVHGGRKAYNHLLCLALSNGIPRKRVDEVLGIVGLETVGDRRAGSFSLGMGQRLGIAAALLGDPRVLMFDEPVNGLDPEGIQWIRNFMRALAGEGRTVFVSSHLMSEMALTADHVVVIGKGKLIRNESITDFIESSSKKTVRVVTPSPGLLGPILDRAGATIKVEDDWAFEVVGLDATRIGELAASNGVVLHELTPHRASLEEAYMELTHESVEFHAQDTPSPDSSAPGPSALSHSAVGSAANGATTEAPAAETAGVGS